MDDTNDANLDPVDADKFERFEQTLAELARAAAQAGIDWADVSKAFLRAAVRATPTLADAAALHPRVREVDHG